MTTYVVVGSKPWNRRVFDESISRNPGRWVFLGRRDELTAERLAKFGPRYVFFLHWSWIVPSSIIDAFECICFHMTDLPFGRGGTPLQNLIVRGYRETVITAFKMTEELDAGPIYLKQPLSLAGNAEEIYIRASEISATMIAQIAEKAPESTPQTGEATIFTRRTSSESRIPSETGDLEELHDHIRMLDAEGYPRAFIEFGPFTLSFKNSVLGDGGIHADVEITRTTGEE